MITYTVNVADGASPALRALLSGIAGEDAVGLNEQGGLAARNAAILYHREYDKAGGWKGPRYMGDGKSDGTSFGADVARGWSLDSFDADGATISNDADHYSFKIRGGLITPKRAKALTIPLVKESRGLYASVYQQNTGKRLFTIKGKNALFERDGKGGIRAIYALLRSVDVKPWPGAVPPEENIADAFSARYRAALMDLIEES